MSKRAGLRDSTIKLVAGAPEDLPADGNYLRISKAQYAVIVEVGNNDVYRLEPGQDVTYPIDDGFTRIRITTTAPIDDLVTITIGNNVKVGSVVLAGAVALTGISSNTSLKVTDIADPGVCHFHSGLQSTGSPREIVAPAANVAGLVVHMAKSVMTNGSTAVGSLALVASSTAPGSLTPGGITAGMFVLAMFARDLDNGWLDRSVYLPPGMGLYWTTETGSYTSIKTVLYKLL